MTSFLHDDLLDPGANWCPDCGLPRGVCTCLPYHLEHDYGLIDDEDDYAPDPNCFFCGGTGLAPNGWDDCPECMGGFDDDDWGDDDE